MATSSPSERHLVHSWTILDSSYLWAILILIFPLIFIDMHIRPRLRRATAGRTKVPVA